MKRFQDFAILHIALLSYSLIKISGRGRKHKQCISWKHILFLLCLSLTSWYHFHFQKCRGSVCVLILFKITFPSIRKRYRIIKQSGNTVLRPNGCSSYWLTRLSFLLTHYYKNIGLSSNCKPSKYKQTASYGKKTMVYKYKWKALFQCQELWILIQVNILNVLFHL